MAATSLHRSPLTACCSPPPPSLRPADGRCIQRARQARAAPLGAAVSLISLRPLLGTT